MPGINLGPNQRPDFSIRSLRGDLHDFPTPYRGIVLMRRGGSVVPGASQNGADFVKYVEVDKQVRSHEADRVAQPSGHFETLDALRGVCAILTVLFHFHVQGVIYSLPIVRHGWMFVDFFFVLSGFVILHTYGERLADGSVGLARFMILRVARIYPLHLFMLVVLIGYELLRSMGLGSGRPAFDEAHSMAAIVSNLALLQAMGVHHGLTWNGVSWSIAAEMWAYLLFGVVFVVWPREGLKLFGAFGLAALVLLLWLSRDGLDATYDNGYLRGILGFSIGVGVRAAYGAGLRAGGTLLECAAVVTMVIVVTIVPEGRATFLLLPVMALNVLVFASRGGAVSRILGTRIPRFLGTISYSIYMTHSLALVIAFEVIKRSGSLGFTFGAGKLGDEVAAPPVLGDLAVLGTLSLTVAIAAITYRFVEMPARDWARSFASRRMPVRPTRAAAGTV
jgi:peptidoglycan/LPS O-acetylase OafA/YrhL